MLERLGIAFFEGFFREISSPPKANLSKERKYPFKELVAKMLVEVNIVRSRATRRRDCLVQFQ